MRKRIKSGWILFTVCITAISVLSVRAPEKVDAKLLAHYTKIYDQLGSDLAMRISDTKDEFKAISLLASDSLDADLVKFVVMHEATPAGLAA